MRLVSRARSKAYLASFQVFRGGVGGKDCDDCRSRVLSSFWDSSIGHKPALYFSSPRKPDHTRNSASSYGRQDIHLHSYDDFPPQFLRQFARWQSRWRTCRKPFISGCYSSTTTDLFVRLIYCSSGGLILLALYEINEWFDGERLSGTVCRVRVRSGRRTVGDDHVDDVFLCKVSCYAAVILWHGKPTNKLVWPTVLVN